VYAETRQAEDGQGRQGQRVGLIGKAWVALQVMEA
jgi:hypothetical protein